MKTKDKILLKSLELFNRDGYNSVTTRHIAKELNISPGNLHYHFQHSIEIVHVHLSNLLEKTEILINDFIQIKNVTIESLFEYLKKVFNLFYDYRFVSISFTDIMLDVPDLKKSYLKIYDKRERQFLDLVTRFQSLGLFKENIHQKIIDSTISQIFVITDCFILHNRMRHNFERNAAIDNYLEITVNLFIPLFTENQLEKYLNNFIIKNDE